ncbi:MAG: hypothetical protein M3256_25330, partial [Actinomycetota bacterium]|nr:hypothetical protein [Actinomycetota bacterium]
MPLLLGVSWHEDQPGGLNRYHADLFLALRAVGLHPWAVTLGPAICAPVGMVTGGRTDDPVIVRLWR